MVRHKNISRLREGGKLHELTEKFERTKRAISVLQETLSLPIYSELAHRQYAIWLEELIEIHNESLKKMEFELNAAQKAKKSL